MTRSLKLVMRLSTNCPVTMSGYVVDVATRPSMPMRKGSESACMSPPGAGPLAVLAAHDLRTSSWTGVPELAGHAGHHGRVGHPRHVHLRLVDVAGHGVLHPPDVPQPVVGSVEGDLLAGLE